MEDQDKPKAAPASSEWDVSAVIAVLDEAGRLYHDVFGGHVANEVARFDAFLATLCAIVHQSADMAPKNIEMAAREKLASDSGVIHPMNLPAPVPASA